MTESVLPRPTSGDVVAVIIDDHRVMESLLRDIRDSSGDRETARREFSALLVAHSLAEETKVYPTLRRKADGVGEHEQEHGIEEHAEGLVALMELLDAKGTDTQKFDDAAEKVSNYLYHHIVEEELTILNPARQEVSEAIRADLGREFLAERGRQLDADCGAEDNVRRIVDERLKQGVLETTDIPDAPAD